jgi:hypothetical protein
MRVRSLMMMREELQAAAEGLRTLEEVMRWGLGRGHSLVEVVAQDEFTNDVIFAAPPGWLVFDTT